MYLCVTAPYAVKDGTGNSDSWNQAESLTVPNAVITYNRLLETQTMPIIGISTLRQRLVK